MKKIKKIITFIIEKTNTGFSAYTIELPIYTTGSTINQLFNNIIEATNLYYEDVELEITSKNIKLEIDFKQFFKHYKVLNAKHLASRINMNESLLSQYVSGKKKPSKKQTQKILDGIHAIGKELTELQLILR